MNSLVNADGHAQSNLPSITGKDTPNTIAQDGLTEKRKPTDFFVCVKCQESKNIYIHFIVMRIFYVV